RAGEAERVRAAGLDRGRQPDRLPGSVFELVVGVGTDMVDREAELETRPARRLEADAGAHRPRAGRLIGDALVDDLRREPGADAGREGPPVGDTELEIVAAERAGQIAEHVALFDGLGVERA